MRGYLDFYNWLKRADLGDPAFLKLNSTIDVRNYLNYLLVQIYLNNIDSMGNVDSGERTTNLRFAGFFTTRTWGWTGASLPHGITSGTD